MTLGLVEFHFKQDPKSINSFIKLFLEPHFFNPLILLVALIGLLSLILFIGLVSFLVVYSMKFFQGLYMIAQISILINILTTLRIQHPSFYKFFRFLGFLLQPIDLHFPYPLSFFKPINSSADLKTSSTSLFPSSASLAVLRYDIPICFHPWYPPIELTELWPPLIHFTNLLDIHQKIPFLARFRIWNRLNLC